ncbi:hypothetical protein NL529_28595, partial [Klebsiella pneumoniae]|nr:hypothetical protein [Klebsiella pneumoniae]
MTVLSYPGGVPTEASEEGADFVDTFQAARMKAVIDRLLAEAPKLETPGLGVDQTQTPAITVQVLLRG